MQLCSGNRKRLEYLRLGLRHMYTDAKTRWPEVFASRKFGKMFREKEFIDEIRCIPNLNINLINVDIIRAAMTKGNVRVQDIHTLYMQSWCVAFKQLVPVPVRLRALMLLRWSVDKEILEVFRHMAQTSVDHGGRNQFRMRLDDFYKLCVLLQPSGIVSDRIKSTTREEIVDLVSASGSQTLKHDLSLLLYQFTRRGRWCGFVRPWMDWQPISKREVGYRVLKRARDRNSLTWEELQCLFDVTKDDARDDALLRYYIHTSRRNASARELLVEDVWDEVTGKVRASGVVLEKFNQRVTFHIDEVLGAALTRWIQESGVTRFVFPAFTDKNHKWSQSCPGTWLLRICKKAGITGSHVHVHGLRHTVATLLHKSGNKIEDISSYLGHKSVTTTQIYIDQRVSRPQDRMAIPWLTADGDLAGLRLSSTSIARIAEDAGCVTAQSSSSSSSSSTTSTSLGSVMLNATQQQQQLVVALTRRLAETQSLLGQRDAEVHHHTEMYNYLVQHVLTDVQRLQLGEWQRQHPPGREEGDHEQKPTASRPTWQEMLAQTYADADAAAEQDLDDTAVEGSEEDQDDAQVSDNSDSD